MAVKIFKDTISSSINCYKHGLFSNLELNENRHLHDKSYAKRLEITVLSNLLNLNVVCCPTIFAQTSISQKFT